MNCKYGGNGQRSARERSLHAPQCRTVFSAGQEREKLQCPPTKCLISPGQKETGAGEFRAYIPHQLKWCFRRSAHKVSLTPQTLVLFPVNHLQNCQKCATLSNFRCAAVHSRFDMCCRRCAPVVRVRASVRLSVCMPICLSLPFSLCVHVCVCVCVCVLITCADSGSTGCVWWWDLSGSAPNDMLPGIFAQPHWVSALNHQSETDTEEIMHTHTHCMQT